MLFSGTLQNADGKARIMNYQMKLPVELGKNYYNMDKYIALKMTGYEIQKLS